MNKSVKGSSLSMVDNLKEARPRKARHRERPKIVRWQVLPMFLVSSNNISCTWSFKLSNQSFRNVIFI